MNVSPNAGAWSKLGPGMTEPTPNASVRRVRLKHFVPFVGFLVPSIVIGSGLSPG